MSPDHLTPFRSLSRTSKIRNVENPTLIRSNRIEMVFGEAADAVETRGRSRLGRSKGGGGAEARGGAPTRKTQRHDCDQSETRVTRKRTTNPSAVASSPYVFDFCSSYQHMWAGLTSAGSHPRRIYSFLPFIVSGYAC